MTEGTLKTVAIVYSQPEAAVLLSALRSYGHFALGHSQGTVAALPTHLIALGGIRICVPANEFADAVEILGSCDKGWRLPPTSYSDNRFVNLLLGLLLLGLGGFAPPPRVRGDYAWQPGVSRGAP